MHHMFSPRSPTCYDDKASEGKVPTEISTLINQGGWRGADGERLHQLQSRHPEAGNGAMTRLTPVSRDTIMADTFSQPRDGH